MVENLIGRVSVVIENYDKLSLNCELRRADKQALRQPLR